MEAKRKKHSKITNFFQVTGKKEEKEKELIKESESSSLLDEQKIQETASVSESVEEEAKSPPLQHEKGGGNDETLPSTSTTEEREESFHDDEPNHPTDCSIIPPKETKSQRIFFQRKWFSQYPWLHYKPDIRGVVCFDCRRADLMGILTLSKKRDPAFISDGFSNWKKATERFDGHQISETHRYAVAQLKAKKKPSIDSQLNKQIKEQQDAARHSLVKVFASMRYLLRQGLPFRRRKADEGNLEQLLKMLSDDDPQLCSYLKKTTKFTSPTSQEEIIQIIAHKVGREVAKDIGEHGIFGIMVDGTQDISGMEQEAICFRHIDRNFDIHESFVGLYNIPDTCSETIANMIFDVMTRLQLNPQNLRAQTYDGAANMKGKHNGCQAKVKSKQPLALHFHCASHMANLVLEHAVTACQPIRDAIQWVNDLGVLFKRSAKYKAIFQEIASRSSELDDSSEQDHLPAGRKTIRPLCQTRWLCRLPAIISVLDNYEAVVESLQEMATASTSDSAAKANGLLDRFQKGATLLALTMAANPIAVLEQLNSACQAQSSNVSGMMAATSICSKQLKSWRTEENFHDVFGEASAKIEAYDLDPLDLPRKRKCPRKLGGTASDFHHSKPEELYRPHYFHFLDRLIGEMEERFDVTSNKDLATYVELESVLLTGKTEEHQEAIIEEYPELTRGTLSLQLQMFKQSMGATTLYDVKLAFQKMHSEVRALFPQVEALLRLLLVCPVSSSTCERSFSALRRLKSWLRNSMCQMRLNCVAICHTHQAILDHLNIEELCEEFAMRSDTRRKIFGHY